MCDLAKNELTEEAGDDKEMAQSRVIMQIRKICSRTISPSGIQAEKPKVNSKATPGAFINKSKGTGLHSIKWIAPATAITQICRKLYRHSKQHLCKAKDNYSSRNKYSPFRQNYLPFLFSSHCWENKKSSTLLSLLSTEGLTMSSIWPFVALVTP